MEIHEIGGILSTVRATRSLTNGIYDKAWENDRMLTFGTTIEAKRIWAGLRNRVAVFASADC